MPAPQQSQLIAARLEDIAATMADEASELTATMRSVVGQTREISDLAMKLDGAAEQIVDNVNAQLQALKLARRHFGEHDQLVAALTLSIDTMVDMCAQVRELAGQSRLLSLNARIEAARGGQVGQGFAVIAGSMTDLTGQAEQATRDVDGRVASIAGNVTNAGQLIVRSAELVADQEAAIGSVMEAAAAQRSGASAVAVLTDETVEQIEGAATGIGRVSSAASVIRVLARQLLRSADQTGTGEAKVA